MNAIVCDKCGLVIVDKNEIKKTTKVIFSTDRVGKFSENDFCDDCLDEFSEWLNKSEGD